MGFSEGLSLPLMEEFYTLQGEGFHTGKPAYFLRLGGCDIGCSWCDSKKSWSADVNQLIPVDELAERIIKYPSKAVVVTGGEPTLYNLKPFTDIMRRQGITTFLETSGSYKLTGHWDWICFSPKRHHKPLMEYFEKANELKIIVEDPEKDLEWARENAFRVTEECTLFLQPEWSRREEISTIIFEYIRLHPKWRLSIQMHKYLGLP